MTSERVVVVGGGIGGLATALALGRAGHAVTVLERDHVPVAPSADDAFRAERRGAPQVHQTHGFLARLVVELRTRFPDVLDQLLAAGCVTFPTTVGLGDPQPGDEDLRVLVVRRTTLEWVLRQAAIAEAAIDLRAGTGVEGVLATPGAPGHPPVVTGVRLDDGSHLDADVVVAAHGRRADVPGWLRDIGVEVAETVHESGLMYLTRWYHLPGGTTMDLDPKLGGDLGFVKYLGVPGDGDTLSITLAIRTDDRELRAALSDPDRFERACRLLPGPDRFFRHGPLEPIGDVRPMGGLVNRLRRFTDDDGEPTVVGFHAVGDAHTCTNPLYGRGCALAFVQATHLADAFAAHPGDPAGRARAFEAAARRDVEPWYEVSVQMDRMGADPAGLAGLGQGGADAGGSAGDPDDRSDRHDPTDGGDDRARAEAMRGLRAILVAAATDPVIGRAMARFWNLLALPSDLMADPALLGRIAEVVADPDAYPLPPRDGPERGELLDALAEPEATPLRHDGAMTVVTT